MATDLYLRNGSRVAIIGGGPAGSLCAHFLQKFARLKGIQLHTTLFDGKNFLNTGPHGCNLCAGVIAESLNQKLKEEGIFLPEKRIINRVDGYCLHLNQERLNLTCKEQKNNSIVTVFRGSGPRFSRFPESVSFDDFLLTWAQDQGTEIISSPVIKVELPEKSHQPALLYYGHKNSPERLEADLIVGAFGVNSFLLHKLTASKTGYKPPSTQVTFQAEIKLGKREVQQSLENFIHIFTPRKSSIRYASLIPKGDYLSVTLIGKKDIHRHIFREFLSQKKISAEFLPSGIRPQCFCFPRINISPAKNPFFNRMVIIGDASFSRRYKNGLESAFVTAKLAAETAVFYGISSRAFAENYYRKSKNLIIKDNTYGRLLFFLNNIISRSPWLIESQMALLKGKNKIIKKKIGFILWNMLTGNIPYQKIFRKIWDPKLQLALLVQTWNQFFIQIKKYLIQRTKNFPEG